MSGAGKAQDKTWYITVGRLMSFHRYADWLYVVVHGKKRKVDMVSLEEGDSKTALLNSE